MDVSGGSGQPRSGNEESADRHGGPTTPATDSPRQEPEAASAPDSAGREARAEGPRSGAPESAGDDTRCAPGDSEPHTTPGTAPTDSGAGGTSRGTGTGTGTAPTDSGGTGPAHDTHPDRAHAHAGTGPTPPPRRPREPGGGLLMGRPFGVPVYVAPSWFLVAALITWVFGGQLDRVLPGLGAARYLVSLFFAVAFYASVLVHELAHTVAALRFKLPVRRIQLQFFGGVSEIEKEAETPGREFVLAFVGPLLSLILAGVFYLALQPVERGTVPGVLLAGLMISNLIVAAFNLLPGLPLDGGRMLRAVVWKITGRPMSGTIAAAWVGRALAVSVLIGLPLLTQSGALGSTAEDSVGMDTVTDALLAAILAAIIWTGAGNSLRMARLREHLPELRARTLTRRAVPVETSTSLSEALRRANAAGARALVVVDGHGEPLSLVRESAIVGVPEHRRPWVYASELAQDLTDGMRVSAELAGEDLLDVLRATPATEYLVVEETGEIYGVLSAADVERAFVNAMARPSASS
ncbi:site-2 protease family protein [Streptomyces sp. NPDC046197]|uniref:site-2 protease family protein n=1 Tax=Streptomyces sp. NPDC046197 TaxID=3154337 RepID=UPI0033CE515D